MIRPEAFHLTYADENMVYYSPDDSWGSEVSTPNPADKKFIITADETQIDLKNIKESGILSAKKVLKNIKGISFVTLNESDVVRHELVKKIIKKYKKN